MTTDTAEDRKHWRFMIRAGTLLPVRGFAKLKKSKKRDNYASGWVRSRSECCLFVGELSQNSHMLVLKN